MLQFKKIYNTFVQKYELNRFIRFGMVGVTNTSIDFLIFFLLKNIFGFYITYCQIAGYCAGILNSFILNKIWTFEDKKSYYKSAVQFSRFIVVNFISLGSTLLGLKILTEMMGFRVLIAKIIVTLISQLINYNGYRFWVFFKNNFKEELE